MKRKRIKRTTKRSRTKRRRTKWKKSRRRMERGRSATLAVVPLSGNLGEKKRARWGGGKDSSEKNGRAGREIFVRVRSTWCDDGNICGRKITEKQKDVYNSNRKEEKEMCHSSLGSSLLCCH